MVKLANRFKGDPQVFLPKNSLKKLAGSIAILNHSSVSVIAVSSVVVNTLVLVALNVCIAHDCYCMTVAVYGSSL